MFSFFSFIVLQIFEHCSGMHALCLKYNAPQIVECIRICCTRKYINVVSLFIYLFNGAVRKNYLTENCGG